MGVYVSTLYKISVKTKVQDRIKIRPCAKAQAIIEESIVLNFANFLFWTFCSMLLSESNVCGRAFVLI